MGLRKLRMCERSNTVLTREKEREREGGTGRKNLFLGIFRLFFERKYRNI